MTDKSYLERLKSAARDPLWWVKLLVAVFAVVFFGLSLAGVVDTSLGPCKIVIQCIIGLFGICFVIEGVRGRYPGKDKPMSTGERIAGIGAGALLVGAVIITSILSSL